MRSTLERSPGGRVRLPPGRRLPGDLPPPRAQGYGPGVDRPNRADVRDEGASERHPPARRIAIVAIGVAILLVAGVIALIGTSSTARNHLENPGSAPGAPRPVGVRGSGPWPATGEMDVVEGSRGLVTYDFHSPAGGFGGEVHRQLPGWHILAATWEARRVTYY